jgi:hypothetical protein
MVNNFGCPQTEVLITSLNKQQKINKQWSLHFHLHYGP